jgi:hypothetical protein
MGCSSEYFGLNRTTEENVCSLQKNNLSLPFYVKTILSCYNSYIIVNYVVNYNS